MERSDEMVISRCWEAHMGKPRFKKTTTGKLFMGMTAAALFVPALLIVWTAYSPQGMSWTITGIASGCVFVVGLFIAFGLGMFIMKVTQEKVIFGLWWLPKRFSLEDLVSARPCYHDEWVADLGNFKRVGLRWVFKNGVRMRFKGVSKDYIFDIDHPEVVCEVLRAEKQGFSAAAGLR
jgi:hypothetical protein